MLAGRGAWQDWLYEVQVVSSRTNRTLTLRAERSKSVTVSGLLPDSVYAVRVRAHSTAGSGPWSPNFTAQTLSAGIVTSTEELISLPWFVIGLFVCLFVGWITQRDIHFHSFVCLHPATRSITASCT